MKLHSSFSRLCFIAPGLCLVAELRLADWKQENESTSQNQYVSALNISIVSIIIILNQILDTQQQKCTIY